MIIYYSEQSLRNEIIEYLRKFFPRGGITSNYFTVSRADTIDYQLLLKYFNCVITHQHNLFKAAIILPTSLEGRVPSWFVKSDNELWVQPRLDLKAQNIYGDDNFVLEFNFYIHEDNIHKFPETKNVSVPEALIGEFIEIRHALIEGNEEPIEIFKGVYQTGRYKTPKSNTARYLASILTVPH